MKKSSVLACYENTAGRKRQAPHRDYSVSPSSLSSEFQDMRNLVSEKKMEGVLGKIQSSSRLYSLHPIKGMVVGTDSYSSDPSIHELDLWEF